jgi:FKBP-type peptidyl-prolyl cis-trans isomerase SlyD
VAQVLGVAAGKLGHPVAVLVLMEAGDQTDGPPFVRVGSLSDDALVKLPALHSLQKVCPMLIAANKAVSIDYTLTNDAGEVIDSSAGGAPLVYLHGAGNIIPGLEKALEGKQVGDELTVAIEPEDAYGEYSAELVSTLSRSMFEGVDELEVGMQFHASAPDGQMQIVTIRDIDGDDVTVDGNHPLAGQRLNFQVKVVDVRDASQEEIAHGHIHGEGGHHH